MVDTARVQVTREKKAMMRESMAKIDAEYTTRDIWKISKTCL